jgi:hypothetical protein
MRLKSYPIVDAGAALTGNADVWLGSVISGCHEPGNGFAAADTFPCQAETGFFHFSLGGHIGPQVVLVPLFGVSRGAVKSGFLCFDHRKIQGDEKRNGRKEERREKKERKKGRTSGPIAGCWTKELKKTPLILSPDYQARFIS